MEEVNHLIDVLVRTRKALEDEDTNELKQLSDSTLHSASVYQHTDYILVAVIIYTLSKLVERKDQIKIKNWQHFVREVNSLLSVAITSMQRGKHSKFIKLLSKTKRYIETYSPDMKSLVEELLRKASINKASKIYEHGISMAKTTNLLGVSPWELTEYIGERENSQVQLNKTIDAKLRVQMAMEFFE